jgi:very-short-patch-repair endonuclease
MNQRVDPLKVDRARQFRRNPTPAEGALWQRLRGRKLQGLHFRRQQVIHGFLVDFYCNPQRLVVEVDGDVHDLAAEADAQRQEVLRACGLRVLRVNQEDVLGRPDGVLARIAEACGVVAPLPATVG